MTTTDLAVLLLRLFMGGFFLCAAYRKTLEPGMREAWPKLRTRLGLPGFWTWLIPLTQFAGGLGLVFGVLTSLAATGLFVILAGALALDVWRPFCRVNAGNTKAAWFYNACENYHILMLLVLLVIILTGGGFLSLDNLARGLI